MPQALEKRRAGATPNVWPQHSWQRHKFVGAQTRYMRLICNGKRGRSACPNAPQTVNEPHHLEMTDALPQIIAGGNAKALESYLENLKPMQTARALARLTDHERARLVALLSPEEVAEVMTDLSDEQAADLLEDMSPRQAAAIVQELPATSRPTFSGKSTRTPPPTFSSTSHPRTPATPAA